MEVYLPLVTSFVEEFSGGLSEHLRYGGTGVASGWPEEENWLKEEEVSLRPRWRRYGSELPITAI